MKLRGAMAVGVLVAAMASGATASAAPKPTVAKMQAAVKRAEATLQPGLAETEADLKALGDPSAINGLEFATAVKPLGLAAENADLVLVKARWTGGRVATDERRLAKAYAYLGEICSGIPTSARFNKAINAVLPADDSLRYDLGLRQS